MRAIIGATIIDGVMLKTDNDIDGVMPEDREMEKPEI